MGGKQLGFSDDELTTAKKQTKREKFLAEMEVVVPWQALLRLCHGMDMNTKARAVELYAEELQLSIFDPMCVGYALLRNAEGGLDALVKEDRDRGARHGDFDALDMWSMTSGRLTSVRMTLRAMLETPTDLG